MIFFIISMAIWRITHLVSKEDGPFNIIYRLRKLAGVGMGGAAGLFLLLQYLGLLAVCPGDGGRVEGEAAFLDGIFGPCLSAEKIYGEGRG